MGRIVEKWSFRRSNYFDFVGDEIKATTNGVGLQDMSAFAKMEVSGPGARAWLDPSSPTNAAKARAHRAVPSAHRTWRRAGRIHGL